jgi:hypothetical protein
VGDERNWLGESHSMHLTVKVLTNILSGIHTGQKLDEET